MKLNIAINDVNNEKNKEFIEMLKKCEIFFIVYDIKNRKSMENIEYWIDVVTKVKDNINKILIYILANKKDKNEGNNELIGEGKNFAVDNNYMFKTISAKDNEGISGIIEESVQNYLAIP